MDNDLMKDYRDWKVISKRIEQSEYIIEDKNPDITYFRRIVLEEVFNGAIENWRDVWQKLVSLDDFKETNRSDIDNDRKLLWNNYENRTLRVIDLFPKQSSLNVNDIKLRSNQFSGRFIFGLLSGFGGESKL